MTTRGLTTLTCLCVALFGCAACTRAGEDKRAETARTMVSPGPEVDASARRTFRLFSAWLAAFNSGDPKRYLAFVEKKFPSRMTAIGGDMAIRQLTGGLDLREVTSFSSTEMRGSLRERDSGHSIDFVLFTSIKVDPSMYGNWNIGQPHVIADLLFRPLPSPADLRSVGCHRLRVPCKRPR